MKKEYKVPLLFLSALLIVIVVPIVISEYVWSPTEIVQPWHSEASATFSRGNLDSSNVTVADVFQVKEETWSIRLSSYDMHWITGAPANDHYAN